MEYLETAIIGGGQAGLATSYYLKREGQEHLIFDKASKPASAWRNGRWDSFTLATPNWTVRMPGVEIKDDPDGFMPRQQIVNFFENYIKEFDLPVQYNSEVTSVDNRNVGYLVKTKDKEYRVKNVVVATGLFQQPRKPSFASDISDNILQISNEQYRNPEQLPSGGVLVVGSGQSGAQIAEELYLAGRNVFLGTGCTSGRVPRRYRGKDILEWLEIMGFFDLTFDQMPPGTGRFDAIPHVTGNKGGHTLNLHKFRRDGVRLLGRLKGADEKHVYISPDLYTNLTRIDQFEKNTIDAIDGYIRMTNMDVPQEDIEVLDDGYNEPLHEVIDLKEENINSIIWSCGYSFDYSFINLPIHDEAGYPIQDSGVTKYPGLFFVGLPWMPNQRSGFLIGMAEYAKDIAYRLV